jgi:ABC-2 type transport system ATP-binding protein
MIVETRDLWLRFAQHEALKRVNLAVPEGSAFALIGPNGAGKSTTLRVLMGMLQPTRGTAHVLGVETRKLRPDDFSRIGYVAEGQNLPGALSCGQYLAYLRPFYSTWDTELERSLLQTLRLPLETRIKNLSRGMRMKLALVSALPYRPKVLIMDEPLSGLDPLVRDELLEAMLQQADEMTILISSHELTEIEGLVTHVAFLDEGRLLLQEAMADLAGRLREMRVTLDREATAPAQIPKEWLQVRTAGNVLSFVETRFSAQETTRRIAEMIPGIRDIDAQPIALRSIFTTLARAARDTGGRA